MRSCHPIAKFMASTPISIVIPTLNEERYLPVLLESIFRCSEPAMEIIISNSPNTTDRTVDVIEYYKERAPSHITIKGLLAPVAGVSNQRNFGASHATNDVIIFFDADACIPFPTRIKELVDLFIDENLAVASCRFLPLDKDPRALMYYGTLYGFHKLMEKITPYALGACIITKKDVFNKCHGFDPSIKVNEDANYCMKASNYGAFKILPVVLQVSTRRFRQYGYVRMGFQYVWMFVYRTLFGESRDNKIPYEWGKYES